MRRILLPIAMLLLAACGTDVSGPSASLFGCVFGEPRALQVGEVATFNGAGNRSLCLSATEGASYVYVPFFAAPPPQSDESPVQLAVEVLGAGMSTAALGAEPIQPPIAFPDAERRPGLEDALDGLPPLRLGGDIHRRLREREIAELGPKIRSAPRPRDGWTPSPSAAAEVPGVGGMMELNVALSCTAQRVRTGEVVRVSEHAILLADIDNPANGLTPADYAQFAMAFDTLIYPVATRHFGTPSDIDGNGRTVIFFTSAVNQLSQPGTSSFTAAVFWSGDLFPATATARLEACPAGNQAEVFYVAVPDPTGSVGPAVPVSWLRERAVQVMMHEYQHLLNAARRLHVNQAGVFEQTWLNEGLSHIAEELLFFEAAGLTPRSNLTLAALQATPGGVSAFNRYMSSNYHNLTRYLEAAGAGSPMGIDNFKTRGAAWSFLRYAADRTAAGDESVFFRLLNSTLSGLENLDAALGVPALAWMHDWTVALYADDHVPGLDSRYTQPSWNFREIFGSSGQKYPLDPILLQAGRNQRLTLQPGGTAHLAFAVDPGGRAAIHIEAGGSTPPRTLRGSFLRLR
jgi:hypothetical protein